MALIQSGASADLLTVGATSKAARVELYDSSGVALQAPVTGAYMLPVNVEQSAATAAGSTVWAMRYVTGAINVKIRRIHVNVAFDGGPAAATSVSYQLCRFSAATPTGGTAITVIKKRTAFAGSVVTDARFLDTGLTVAGVTFETPFAQFRLPVSATGVISSERVIDFDTPLSEIYLASGEGLAIQLDQIAVAGQMISGFIAWDEV